ncbi:MAG: HNH endonuclease signature motif containing protein, partial [Pseudonocardiaceae bacterium]
TNLNVTSSLETLLGLDGAPAAEMDFSLPISSTTVERLACDSRVTRLLLGSESQVIDVGRSRRVVSGPGRKALQARDRHCRWPNCDRPAKWSAAHHVVHWIHGGTTDLDNLVLLCHRHHWLVHEGRWQLVRGDGGQMIAIPPTVTFGPPARGPD